MPQDESRADDGAYQFIQKNIDSVPQLEALILLWSSRPAAWTLEDLADRLYVPADRALEAARDLVRVGVAAPAPGDPKSFRYASSSPEQDDLMSQVHRAYRHDLVRISHMIHSKASSSVREFARAFRFKREEDK